MFYESSSKECKTSCVPSYKDITNNKGHCCPVDCEVCGDDSTKCLTCIAGRFLEGDVCITTCSGKFFGNSTTRKC